MPRFSVVIPAYNAERTIGETIASVLSQTERDLELLVVDDGSADSTPALVAGVAEGDPRVRLLQQPNAGTAGARNTGIAAAESPLVSFLDNDDLWMPRYLESMGAALDAAPKAAFAYCNAFALDDATLRIRRLTEFDTRPPPQPGATWDEIALALARTNFVMSSATVRRAVLEQVGGFRDDVHGVDDYDLWLRIVLEGHACVSAGASPLLLQRDLPDSQSKADLPMLAGLVTTLMRAVDDGRLPPAARAAAVEQLEAARARRDALAGGRSPQRLAIAARARAVAVRDRVRDRRKFRDEPPPEVVAAFPTLYSGSEPGARESTDS
jgi:hypothetical protein